MNKKYKMFENKKLETMVIEIDITKCEYNFREIMKFIEKLEEKELNKKDLEIKDIFFK